MHITYSTPKTEQEWQAYFTLRWQMLRAPWNQPQGSERDDLEATAYHVMATAENGEVIGCGRLHRIDAGGAQIRYMAVAPPLQGRGIGQAILNMLETRAKKWLCHEIILNARTSALNFYQANNYRINGEGPLLFNCIGHKRMQKHL